MKNIGLKAAGMLVILAVVIGSVTDVFSSSTNLELHEQLLEENVDLFGGGGGPLPSPCHGGGRADPNEFMTYCPTCTMVTGFFGTGSEASCIPNNPVIN